MWRPITVAESGNPPLEVTLSDEVGRLAGSVTNGSTAVPGALVVARRIGGPPNLNQYALPVISTADGSYLISALIPGNYEVTAMKPNPSGSISMGPAGTCAARIGKAEITAGQTSILPLQVCQ